MHRDPLYIRASGFGGRKSACFWGLGKLFRGFPLRAFSVLQNSKSVFSR